MVAQATGGYADIYTWANLYTAYRKAAKGKRSRRPAAAFEFKMSTQLSFRPEGGIWWRISRYCSK